jgi:hypothetical protein
MITVAKRAKGASVHGNIVALGIYKGISALEQARTIRHQSQSLPSHHKEFTNQSIHINPHQST